MSYYHEARDHVKALKKMSEDNKRRQERRAEIYEAQNEHPLHAIRIDGRSCQFYTNQEQYEAVERMEGLVAWRGGGEDVTIDRFDVRAMLDMWIPPRGKAQRPMTDEELELEEMVAFESYRDLIPLAQRRLFEEEGIAEAEKQNISLRAAARAAATAAAGLKEKGAHVDVPTSGFGNFGAVHYKYDDGQVEDSEDSSGEDEGGSDMDLEDSDEEAEPIGGATGAEEVAKQFGLANFEVLLRRETRREEADGDVQKHPRRRRNSRKKAAARARRMAGQGLDPYAGSKKGSLPSMRHRDDRGPITTAMLARAATRGSPEYDRFTGGDDEEERRANASKHTAQQVEFITEFAIGDQQASAAVPYMEADVADNPIRSSKAAIREAMPSMMDPSVEGPVALPSAGSQMHGVRAAQYVDREAQMERERRARERATERDRARRVEAGDDVSLSPPRGRPASPPVRGRAHKQISSRSRSRSSSRGRSRSRSTSRSRDRHSRRSRSQSRGHVHSRRDRRGRSRSRSGSQRRRGKDRDSHGRSRSHRRSERSRGFRSRSRSHSSSRSQGSGRSSHRMRRSRYRNSRSRSGSRSRHHRGRSPGSEKQERTDVGRGAEKKSLKSLTESSVMASSSAAANKSSGPTKKETAAERMKRIMAAQLNKQVQKDNLSTAAKKVQLEKDRVAREQQQKTMYYNDRSRRRSRSPDYYR